MFERTEKLILDGVGNAYPCAAVAVGRGHEVFLRRFVGQRQTQPFPLPVTEDTLFDLASVSKTVSATMITLKLWEEGKLSLDDPISRYLDACGNYGDCRIRHLLTHTSGIRPHMPLDRMAHPQGVLQTILSSEPNCGIGEEVYYSCMGYIVLAGLLEKVCGEGLDRLAQRYVFDPLGMKTACYSPDAGHSFAATEFCKEIGRWKTGTVHDENACYLGGVAGNAGIFATLDDMVAFVGMCSAKGVTRAGEVYLKPTSFAEALVNRTPTLSQSRGYGFQLKGDQPSPMGERMSRGSYGHTGFTGTSFYVDRESGFWGIFLTNAVHYGRDNRQPYFSLRRQFYDLMKTEADMLIGKG